MGKQIKISLWILVVECCLSLKAATLSSTRLAVDTWLTNNFPAVISKQNIYYASHGRYWQGLLTCTGSPTSAPAWSTAANASVVQDNLGSKPYYESESIADIFPGFVGMGLPCAFLCDQYQGPIGDGYIVTVFVLFNGTVYTRSHNTGPEAWREIDWAQWTPGGP